MNFCVTILLNISIQVWTNFLHLFILHNLHFTLFQQFQPFYLKQQMPISTVLKFFTMCSYKFWNVQSQYSWILPTHRTSTGIRRPNRRWRITPPAGVAQSRHRKPPASAKDLTRARKTICGQVSIAWANSSLCSSTRPSHPARIARSSNNSTSPDSDKTIASQFSP